MKPYWRCSPDGSARPIWQSRRGPFCQLAVTLLELAQEFGREVGSGRIIIHQKICRTDLAAMAGVSREHVNRILNDWKRRQLVSQLEGYYCIDNKAQLQKEAEL